MFIKILLVIVVLIAAILAFAATRAYTFRVQRSAVISAPSDKIFPLIDDFHNWATWSPTRSLTRDEAHAERRAERQRRRLCMGGQQQGR